MARVWPWSAVLAVVSVGCASAPAPAPQKPPEPAVITVAVIEFGEALHYGEDGCVTAVVEAGHRAVDKKRLAAALPSDEEIDYQQLGRALGADLIIDGGLPRGAKARQMQPARIVSTQKGDVLASSKSRRRVDKSFEIGHETCAELLKQLP